MVNKHYKKLKGQSLMDKPEILATLGTQDPEQSKKHCKERDEQHRPCLLCTTLCIIDQSQMS
jgi:hypothetical protein